MKAIVGTEGLTCTQQDDFPEMTVCIHCKSDIAAIAFVAHESFKEGWEAPVRRVRELNLNMGNGNLWPHDLCSFAVYLCPKCLEATTLWSQA